MRFSGKPLLRIFCLCASLVLLWGTLHIPVHLRSLGPELLPRAGLGTVQAQERAGDYLLEGKVGPAQLLWQALPGLSPSEGQRLRHAQLLATQPLYAWSGGPAPYYRQLLQLVELPASAQPVLPTLIAGDARRELRAYLQGSSNLVVQDLLALDQQTGWRRFLPVYAPGGQPLEATLLALALLEQSDAFPAGMGRELAQLLSGTRALEGGRAQARFERLALAVMTFGQRLDWSQLREVARVLPSAESWVLAARLFQDRPEALEPLIAALWLTRQPAALLDHLSREDGHWDDLRLALPNGQGAIDLLVGRNARLYVAPTWFERLSLQALSGFAGLTGWVQAQPTQALATKVTLAVFALALCCAAVLPWGTLAGRARETRLLVLGAQLVLAVASALVLWLALEPALMTLPEERAPLMNVNLASIWLGAEGGLAQVSGFSLDQATVLILLLFFLLQLVVFITGLLKIVQVRRRNVPAELKLRLLDNEENLFDLGLYLGLGGTVASLILVVLNAIDASLMAAYASTLFGILFVAVLKVMFLRPYRARLLLDAAPGDDARDALAGAPEPEPAKTPAEEA